METGVTNSGDHGLDVLIVAAVPVELWPFATRLGATEPLGELTRVEHAERRIGLLAAGMGRPADAVFAAALSRLRPATAVNVGIAGALHPDLRSGSTWLVEHWQHPDEPHDRAASADAALARRLAEILDAAGIPWSSATAVTVDRPLHDAAERDRLHADTGSHLVEMEGGRWADIAATAGVPFAAVRVVSDHANRDLPGAGKPQGRRAWMLKEDGSVHRHRLLWALITSRAWLRPVHHYREVKAAGSDFGAALASLHAIAAAFAATPPAPATPRAGNSHAQFGIIR